MIALRLRELGVERRGIDQVEDVLADRGEAALLVAHEEVADRAVLPYAASDAREARRREPSRRRRRLGDGQEDPGHVIRDRTRPGERQRPAGDADAQRARRDHLRLAVLARALARRLVLDRRERSGRGGRGLGRARLLREHRRAEALERVGRARSPRDRRALDPVGDHPARVVGDLARKERAAQRAARHRDEALDRSRHARRHVRAPAHALGDVRGEQQRGELLGRVPRRAQAGARQERERARRGRSRERVEVVGRRRRAAQPGEGIARRLAPVSAHSALVVVDPELTVALGDRERSAAHLLAARDEIHRRLGRRPRRIARPPAVRRLLGHHASGVEDPHPDDALATATAQLDERRADDEPRVVVAAHVEPQHVGSEGVLEHAALAEPLGDRVEEAARVRARRERAAKCAAHVRDGQHREGHNALAMLEVSVALRQLGHGAEGTMQRVGRRGARARAELRAVRATTQAPHRNGAACSRPPSIPARMRNTLDPSSIASPLARAHQLARAALRALRELLQHTPSTSVLEVLDLAAVVLERLEEADVHVTLAATARHPSHAAAHADLALSLAEEALELARRGHATYIAPPPPAPPKRRARREPSVVHREMPMPAA